MFGRKSASEVTLVNSGTGPRLDTVLAVTARRGDLGSLPKTVLICETADEG